MKTRTTLLLLGVFAVVLGYWLLFERHAKTPEEAARDAKKLFPVEDREVRTLAIERPGAPTIRLERIGGGNWRMTEPFAARAERWSADAAATALLEAVQTRSIKNDRGDKGLEEMGLKPPKARITFTLGPAAKKKEPDKDADAAKSADAAGASGTASNTASTSADASGASAASGTPSASGSSGASGTGGPAASPTGAAGKTATGAAASTAAPVDTRTLEIGDAVPTTDSIFAHVGGRDELSLVPSSAVAPLLRTAEEMRDHALVDTTALDVHETRIERPGAEGLRFRRRDGEWWIEEPIQDAAEGAAVQGLLTSLIGLRADTFEDPSAAAGLDPPQATIQLFDAKGASIAEVALGAIVPGDQPKRHVRVTSSGEAPVTALAASADLPGAAQPASAYRARKALSFRSWDATGLNLTSAGVTLSFAKKDGLWTAVAPAALKVSNDAVETTLTSLSDLAVVAFDAASGKPPAALGLDPPKTKIEVRLGEPANKILTLVLGAPGDTPNTLYARTMGRPVFTVPSSILDRISGGAALYQEKAPPPPPQPAPPPAKTGAVPSPPAASGPAGASGAAGAPGASGKGR